MLHLLLSVEVEVTLDLLDNVVMVRCVHSSNPAVESVAEVVLIG